MALEPSEGRKARGAFFTPRELSDHLAQWAVQSPDDRIFEPSCGEAAFLISAAARLKALGSEGPRARQLQGIDIHAASVSAAAERLREIGVRGALRAGDFFDLAAEPIFDAVIGNPPYVRYQRFTGAERAKARRAAQVQGVPLDGLASSWAAFVVHAAGFLGPEGRLALVLPAALLSVNYAGPVRRFLVERFAELRLVLFEKRVFPGVLEEVMLLLAGGSGPAACCELVQARGAGDLRGIQPRRWRPTSAGGKWVEALLPGDTTELYGELVAGGAFAPLREWGDTDLGMVTGSNDFFTLGAAQARALGLREPELLPISPPGSRHLRGLSFGPRAWRGMRADGRRVFLLRPDGRPSPQAARYLREGERSGVSDAYKCRVRSPWWRVPLLDAPDLFLTYMNHDAPRLVWNGARVRHLNSVHGIRLRAGRRRTGALLPIAALNSVTLLGAELVGRAYGGGILKLEPKEADRLPVPSPRVLEGARAALRAVRPAVAEQLGRGALEAAVRLVDGALLEGRLALDRSQIDRLRSGRAFLFARRVARAKDPPHSFRSAASSMPRSRATASTNSSISS